MCHDTIFCIVTEAARLLGCIATQGRDTASQTTTRRWARGWERRQALGSRRWGAGARGDTTLGTTTRPGAQAAGCCDTAGARAGGREGGRVGHAVGAHKARGKSARHGRWARGLGVLLGCGLCTLCTQPFFYLV